MFKQKDYQFFEFASKKISEYTIEPGDQISLQVFSRDGFKLIDIFSSGLVTDVYTEASGGNNSGGILFTIDNQGYVKLPVLGEFYVKGYTHKDLELTLAQKYATLFVNPYVVVKVMNRRVFLFTGSGATVVNLNPTPTSLIEVLAKSGGLDQNMKAYKIRIIRGDLANPTVQLVDLSTLEGLRTADLTLQPNDIISIDRRRRVVRDVLVEISPFMSAISIITSTVVIIRTLGK